MIFYRAGRSFISTFAYQIRDLSLRYETKEI